MAYKLQLKRGLLSALPVGISGEPLFTTDTNDLYISNGTTNQKFQKFIASGISSQFLKGDGSLDSTTYQPLLTNPVTGTGTTNYLPKWTSGSALGDSNLFNDSLGNLGLGVTPSNAFVDSKSFEIGANGIIWSEATSNINNSLILGFNFYFNAAGNILYKNSGIPSSRYKQFQGQHEWLTAPSGTAGNVISYTQAMTLFASGNLGIGVGNTDNGNRLQVNGEASISSSANDYVGLQLTNTNNNASLATSSALKIGITSTVGTHYGTFKITENSANDNTADFTLSLPFGGVESTKLTILGNGNATFTSSVTATSFIKSGGTSSQYLMADGSVTTGGGGGGSVDELQVALLSQVYG